MLITINLAVVAKVILGIILFFVALIVIHIPQLMFVVFELLILYCFIEQAVEKGSILPVLFGIVLACILPLMFLVIHKLDTMIRTSGPRPTVFPMSPEKGDPVVHRESTFNQGDNND